MLFETRLPETRSFARLSAATLAPLAIPRRAGARAPFALHPAVVLMAACLLTAPLARAEHEQLDEQPVDQLTEIMPDADQGARFDEQGAETVTVHGVRQQRASKGATGLDLSWQETPQSVTVLAREWLESFGLEDINQALKMVTGVNVESVETDRTYYNSRGFDIKSMQVDGIGLPFTWNVVGAVDTAAYERVEVIRGANGLLTGTGNPSGTINFVRKRPEAELTGSVDLSVDSFDAVRAVVDVSAPLSESGSWAGRVVAVRQEGGNHLDLYDNERTLLYGIVEGELGDRTVLSFGHSQQDNHSSGVLWGALPLLYSDATQTDYPVETSTSMNWTYFETDNRTSFAELAVTLSDDWLFETVLTHNEYEEPSELFYTYGNPDRDSGLGLFGWPGKYFTATERDLLDVVLTGHFRTGALEHQLLFGVSIADSASYYLDHAVPASDPAWGALPAFPGWTGNEVARPAFGEPFVAGDWQDDYQRLYAVGQFALSDTLKVIAGVNAIDVQSEGFNFGETRDRDEQETSPYVGVTWQLQPELFAYASYSDIFEPQAEIGADLQPLGAARGKSYEAGLKSVLLQETLTGSLALFRAEQDNYAEYAGFDPVSGLSFYQGIAFESEGYELELVGKLSEQWLIMAGYTDLELQNADGSDARTYLPRQTFNFSTRYRPAALADLEVGAALRWQDEIHVSNWLGTIRQPDYLVASAFIRYAINDNVKLGLTIDNLTDEKYLASLYWDQAYYGAPRNATANLSLSF